MYNCMYKETQQAKQHGIACLNKCRTVLMVKNDSAAALDCPKK